MKSKPTFSQSEVRNVDRDNDLQWLAFCYVGEELDEAAREAFDQRLGSDLEAQEALASVVALGRDVFQVESEFQSSPIAQSSPIDQPMPTAIHAVSRSTRRWSILGVAAAVLIIGSVGYGIARHQHHQQQQGHPQTVETNQIASALSPAVDGGLLLDQWLENLDSTDVGNGSESNDREQQTVTVLWEDDTIEENDSWVESNQSEWNIDVSMVAIYSDVFDGLDESHLLELKSSQRRRGVIQ